MAAMRRGGVDADQALVLSLRSVAIAVPRRGRMGMGNRRENWLCCCKWPWSGLVRAVGWHHLGGHNTRKRGSTSSRA